MVQKKKKKKSDYPPTESQLTVWGQLWLTAGWWWTGKPNSSNVSNFFVGEVQSPAVVSDGETGDEEEDK